MFAVHINENPNQRTLGVLRMHIVRNIVRGQLLNKERGSTLEAALEGGEMIFKGWQ